MRQLMGFTSHIGMKHFSWPVIFSNLKIDEYVEERRDFSAKCFLQEVVENEVGGGGICVQWEEHLVKLEASSSDKLFNRRVDRANRTAHDQTALMLYNLRESNKRSAKRGCSFRKQYQR